MFRLFKRKRVSSSEPTEILVSEHYSGADFHVASGRKKLKLGTLNIGYNAHNDLKENGFFSPNASDKSAKEYLSEYLIKIIQKALEDVRDKRSIPDKNDSNSSLRIHSEEGRKVHDTSVLKAFKTFGITNIHLVQNGRLIELGSLTTHFKNFDKHAPLLERALRYRIKQTHGLSLDKIGQVFSTDRKIIASPNDKPHIQTLLRIQEEFACATDQLRFEFTDTPELKSLIEPAVTARDLLIDAIEINRKGLDQLNKVALTRLVRRAGDDIPEAIEAVVKQSKVTNSSDSIQTVAQMLNDFNDAMTSFVHGNTLETTDGEIARTQKIATDLFAQYRR